MAEVTKVQNQVKPQAPLVTFGANLENPSFGFLSVESEKYRINSAEKKPKMSDSHELSSTCCQFTDHISSLSLYKAIMTSKLSSSFNCLIKAGSGMLDACNIRWQFQFC